MIVDRRSSGAARALTSIAAMATVLCAAIGVEDAHARSFPSRPIRVIVPFQPGGGTDVLGRLIGREMSASIGQPIVIENRPGGGGNIGTEVVANAAPDGHTMLIENSNFAMTAGLFTNLSFDKARDFTPVAIISSVPSLLIVHPQKVEAKTVAELITMLRGQPGKLAYTSCGNGGPQHLAGELFKQLTKVDLAHVPYKGCAPALADVIAGQVPIGFNTAANALPHIRAGKLRGLGVTSVKRFPLAPEIPTIAESGLANYDVDQWFGFFVPAKTPGEIVARLHAEITRTVQKAEVRERMSNQGFATVTMGQREYAALVQQEIVRWTRFTREVGIKID